MVPPRLNRLKEMNKKRSGLIFSLLVHIALVRLFRCRLSSLSLSSISSHVQRSAVIRCSGGFTSPNYSRHRLTTYGATEKRLQNCRCWEPLEGQTQ